MMLERGYKFIFMSLVIEIIVLMMFNLFVIVGVLLIIYGVIYWMELIKDFKDLEIERFIKYIVNVVGLWVEKCLEDDWIFRGIFCC